MAATTLSNEPTVVEVHDNQTKSFDMTKIAHDVEFYFAGRMDEIGLRKNVYVLCLLGSSVVAVFAGGLVMIIMISLRASKIDNYDAAGVYVGDHTMSQPSLYVGSGALCGALVLALVFGVLQTKCRSLRASLEYSTCKIQDLREGAKYKYRKVFKGNDATEGDKLENLLHQLRIESELAGWTAEMVSEQSNSVRDHFQAKQDYSRATKSRIETARKKIAIQEIQVIFKTLHHSVKAMNVVIAVFTITFALIIVGIGAMGAFLTVGIADMPDPKWDPFAQEMCWQTLNFIFVILAAWTCPQRVQLLYHVVFRSYEVEIDGLVRSMLIPGVLLTRKKVIILASLRIANVFFTYMTAFFMWAWGPACLQQNYDRHEECTSKPLGGIIIPFGMTMGMLTNALAGILLGNFVGNCPYLTWPDHCAAPDQPLLIEGRDMEVHVQTVWKRIASRKFDASIPPS